MTAFQEALETSERRKADQPFVDLNNAAMGTLEPQWRMPSILALAYQAVEDNWPKVGMMCSFHNEFFDRPTWQAKAVD